ncbi:tetratricopeptide repeat protein [Streptomyces sp. cg40]|uniref:tetratricopeptide repeat protein n=1 Tax=Streptomyces sp. cg40 TaxID=3419764 RepID=UPI003D04CE26
MAPSEDDSTALPLLIFAVTGMGGIGKTALALEAAHRARREGWFPGGTLFVDLRGYDEDPVTADQAVLALLDALGVRDRDLPTTAERQYDAYRALLGERRDRMLVVLDNASDPSQYLPLLPGTDHHRVIITSRDRPVSLPIRLIDLETLAPDESVALVTRALHETDERDERAARETDALRELTELCGYLPLALQIAAGMLRLRHRGIASLVTEIKTAGDPTAILDNGSPGVDVYGRSLVLRPVLETSYRRLPPDQARLLRLLCLAPGAETSTEAIAALTDLDAEAVLSLLDCLAATHLVTPVWSVARTASAMRWRVHDLVRAFGARVTAGETELREEGELARERILAFYLRWADASDDRLRWLPGKDKPEQFTDRAQALAWLDSERANLVPVVQWAREERFTTVAVKLSECLGVYLEWRRYFDDWITVCRTAQDAARHAGNALGEAVAWNSLGLALREAGRTEEAIDAYIRARDMHKNRGDHHREAIVWGNLGLALRDSGRTEEAINAHTRARDMHKNTGHHHLEASAWNNLGSALRMAGRAEEAVEAHTRARDQYQATGDRSREAIAWNNLGLALQDAGRVEEAIEAYGTSLEARQEFDDWYGKGQTFENLGQALKEAHRPAEARTAYLQSADAFTSANAPADAAQARTRATELPE